MSDCGRVWASCNSVKRQRKVIQKIRMEREAMGKYLEIREETDGATTPYEPNAKFSLFFIF